MLMGLHSAGTFGYMLKAMKRCIPRLFLLAALLAVSTAHAAVDVAWVTVGDVGNPPDPRTGFGKVDYAYEIAAFDVTNAQYVEFLNAVDPAGGSPLRLWNRAMSAMHGGGIDFAPFAPVGAKYAVKQGYGNKPFAYGTYYDALRFANWLGNGQGGAGTETGAYTLRGAKPVPDNAATATRNPAAVIALTSEDEWYKAAYYRGGGTYALYATGTAVPSATPPTPAPNAANYDNAVGDYTDVGAYTGSPSHYGTFDQAGNIWNWNETLFPDGSRGARGNAFVHGAECLAATYRHRLDPARPGLHVGIRLVRLQQRTKQSAIQYALLIVGALLGAAGARYAWKKRNPFSASPAGRQPRRRSRASDRAPGAAGPRAGASRGRRGTPGTPPAPPRRPT